MASITASFESRILKLPSHAAVAFAGRCARRVAPVFEFAYSNREPGYCQTLFDAIDAAEAFGAGAPAADFALAWASSRSLNKKLVKYIHADSPNRKSLSAATYAARAASEAAGGGRSTQMQVAMSVLEAAKCALLAGRSLASVAVAMKADLTTVEKFISRCNSLNPPTPPTAFGTLWPSGQPNGWPQCAAYFDAFLSHSSRDKSVAEPVAEGLRRMGFNIWYNDFVHSSGSSARQDIDHGTARSNRGILLISPNFFSPWTRYETNGLLAAERIYGRTLLIVHLNITPDEIFDFSPSLSERKGIRHQSVHDTVTQIASELKTPLSVGSE